MSDAPRPLDAQAVKARSRRNVAIGLALVAFVVIVFTVTVVRLTQNMAARPAPGAPAATTVQAPRG